MIYRRHQLPFTKPGDVVTSGEITCIACFKTCSILIITGVIFARGWLISKQSVPVTRKKTIVEKNAGALIINGLHYQTNCHK
ncbi:hypothetical protein A3860_23570 [Niastella vici]|uniref:Uncharacterized protein n=1 Tax=Niastella vici TaxID=1703345 RepID=A0A1V9G005_9BACT|nr:hypothetical protein A3860_23570 [Niastella vici]